MWRQMEGKKHLSRYKAVLASCHNGQLFWHYPVQDRAHFSPPFPSKQCYFFLVLRLHRPQRLHNIELGAGGIRDLTLDANRSGKKQTDDNVFMKKTTHLNLQYMFRSPNDHLQLKVELN